ncbi:hypothetical protein FGIG_12425 [Fasciola gigantica]|uniref:G-protein coupled receptors family 1 profile domain-containing protein n=1 Tax=Fasciola gigantica TaxID=46835 RepID=A0A504YY92_FASGI|nr:hypothetical protein FGIG_12425 [Fasciola gigantica]
MNAGLLVRFFIGTVGLIGTITNTITFVLLLYHKYGSKLTNILFRAQCLYEGFGCLIMFLRQIFPDVALTNSIFFDRLFCKLWSQDNLFWPGPILAASNLVCISLDRLIAVFKPIFYRSRQRFLLLIFTSYNVINVLVLFTPQLARRQLVNGTCTFHFVMDDHRLNILGSIQAYMLILFTYVLPCLFIITSHAIIIWKIQKIYKSALENSNPSQIKTGSSTSTDEDQEQLRSSPVRRLIIMTVILSTLYIICHSMEAFTYALATSGVLNYIDNPVQQQMGLGLMVLCGCISPLVIVCSTKQLLLKVVNALRSYATITFTRTAVVPQP